MLSIYMFESSFSFQANTGYSITHKTLKIGCFWVCFSSASYIILNLPEWDEYRAWIVAEQDEFSDEDSSCDANPELMK